AYEYKARTDNLPNGDKWVTLDLAIPVPVDSIVFYPPLIGMTAEDPPRRYADLYPEAYEVTRQREVVDWLLLEDETAAAGSPGYHALAETVGRTFANNRTVVSLKTGLAFTRFLRLRFGGVLTDMYLAEIQAFGHGYPAEARYVSQVRSFGVPVTFGAVTWHFTRYRQTPSGVVIEDPSAPVSFRIRTRSGQDADPQAYFVYDERGREVEVSSAYYYSSDVVRVTDAFDEGRPGYRGPITDDTQNWDGWSIDYPASAEQIRSSDARQYFQFAFEITTDDPLAFGVLDSLAFQISPLLADTAVAEVSLDGLPALRADELAVPLGVDTVFVYDLRAVRRGAGRGYNGLDLEVPAGARLLDLEINGQGAAVGSDYAVDESNPELLSLTFLKPVTDELRLRLRLRSALFQSSAFFAGNLVDRTAEADALPQSVLAGNARDDVASDQIQVVAQQLSLDVLGPIEVVPPVLTPNGDGSNDEVALRFTLFGVTDAPLRVRVYDLGGRLVADLRGHDQAASAGRFAPTWNGRDGTGTLVPPGLYLVEVEVDVDRGTVRRMTSLAVAY
ncbi:MAG: hypothetical protein ABIL09_01400, partial [Gemmatimonadota bacterium]